METNLLVCAAAPWFNFSTVLLGIFLLGMIVIGIWGMRKTKTLNDFFLGGRSVGPWVSAFAYGTTYFSAVLFIGFGGKVGWGFGLKGLWIAFGNALVGALLASVAGKAIWQLSESFIMTVPVLKRIYPYVKQVTDFVLTPQEQRKLFSRVVAVEYPRNGMWSIGFVTGSRHIKVAENVEKEFLIIMIPTAPTPVTGYVIMVPKEQTVALDMTVEEAFRFIVSAGVVAPESQRWPALPGFCAGNKIK